MSGNYFELRDWLESFIPQVYTRKELGLERIKYFLKLLGNPHYKFKSIHVAGTSGKGSTCWYIAKLLQNANFQGATLEQVQGSTLKIGLHISPHLVDIRERMQILATTLPFSRKRESRFPIKSGMTGDGSTLMPLNRFLGLFNEIRPIVEKIQKEKSELVPSYFEILVAASFKYFAQEKVDWAVVEVGLGGRFDATNVLLPEVSVITNVGLDHTEILGKTIEKIAFEKAGIIKRGVPVVTGYPSTLLRPVRYTQGKQAQDRSGSSSGRALQVIARVARKQQAPMITIDTQDRLLANKLLAVEAAALVTGQCPAMQGTALMKVQNPKNYLKSDIFSSITKYIDLKRYISENLALSNALLAIATVLTLGFPLSSAIISKAFRTGFAGRFEEIEKGVILDGAHNPDKIRFLIDFVRKLQVTSYKLKVGGIILVIGFKKGKDWKKMVDLLLKEFQISNFKFQIKQVIATKFNAVTDTGRFSAVEPEEIINYLNTRYQILDTKYFQNSQEAVFEALRLRSGSSTQNDRSLVLVTGSLYLVGEARTLWKLPEF